MSMTRWMVRTGWVAAAVLALPLAVARGEDWPVNPVEELRLEIERNEQALLEHDKPHGYLRALLDRLEVPVESQVLVFSKTSLQRRRISPRTPRAIYFNDDVYVGWVQNGDVLEISVADAIDGTAFYTLEQDQPERPVLTRADNSCAQCHDSAMTDYMPGHMVRSVYTDESGQPLLRAGTHLSDHNSPLEERWGGWYVTGTHGAARHMGNQTFAEDIPEEPESVDLSVGANITDLSEYFDTSRYLTPHSDVVALMVLEHQTKMHNLIAKSAAETRGAMEGQKALNEADGRPEDWIRPSTQRRINYAAENLLEYMLFCDEPRLPSPISGTSEFAEVFAANGPSDSGGRPLREFDLTARLFRYPCSYLIYSQAFDAMPAPLRDRLYERLLQVLSAEDMSEPFSHLSKRDRAEILQILVETKPGLPPEWDEAVEQIRPRWRTGRGREGRSRGDEKSSHADAGDNGERD